MAETSTDRGVELLPHELSADSPGETELPYGISRATLEIIARQRGMTPDELIAEQHRKELSRPANTISIDRETLELIHDQWHTNPNQSNHRQSDPDLL